MRFTLSMGVSACCLRTLNPLKYVCMGTPNHRVRTMSACFARGGPRVLFWDLKTGFMKGQFILWVHLRHGTLYRATNAFRKRGNLPHERLGACNRTQIHE